MEAAQKAMEEAQKAAQKAARVSSGRSTSGSAASSGNSRSTQEKTGDEKENADASVLGSLFGKNSESNSGAKTSGAASSKTKAGATKTVKKNGSQAKSGKKTVSSKGTANQAAGSKSGAAASSYLTGENSSQKTPYAAALQDPKRQGQTKATEESRTPSMSDAQAAQWRAAASQASGNNEAAFRVVNSYLEQNENARRLWDLEAAAENSKAKTSARNAMTPEEMKTYRQMRALYDDYGTLWSVGYRASEDFKGLGKQISGSLITLGEGAAQSVKDTAERTESVEGEELRAAQKRMDELYAQGRAYTIDENGVEHPTAEYTAAVQARDAAEDALNQKFPGTVLTPENSTGVRLYGEGSEHLSNAQLGLSGDAKFAMNTANAIAGNAPTMATALIPGVGPGISLGLSGAQAAGGRAAELSAQGESAGAALSRGLVSGGIEAATEILPVGSWVEIINNPGGKSALRSVLQQMGSEATEESASYVANYLADKAAQDPTAQFSLEELAENALMGGLTGGVYGGVGVGINRLRGGSANTQTQEQGATAELGLDDTATSPNGAKNGNNIATANTTDNISSQEFQKNIASRWQPPHNAAEQAATLGITSETPAALGDAMSGSSATQSVAEAMNSVNELPALDDGAAAQYDGFNEGGGIYAGNPDLGRSVSQSSETGYPGGRGTEHQPGSAGTAADGTTGTAGRSSAQEVNYEQRAQAVTGRDRRSPYTRQLQSFYERLAAGEVDSTTMDQEVDQIARGLVRESDYTVEADPGQQTLRNYLKNTRIYVDGKNAAEILNATGLKSISQYNIQNGLNLTTSPDGAVPLDTAMQELSGMSVGYAGDGISPIDDFMQIAARPERQVDSDLLQTNIDYTKEMILDQFTGRQTEDFESWLRTASESNEWGEAPDYIQHVAERYGVNAPAVPAESLGLDDSALAQPATDSGNLWDGTSGVMPEHSIGADMLRDYNRSEVPNLDPGTQRAASFGLVSPEDISGLGLGEQTHQLYSFREAGDNAVADFEVAVQQNAGDEIAASAQIMDELKSKNDWNADDFATMQEVEHRLQNQLSMTEQGSAEYNLVKERLKMAYESHSRASSRTGRALVQNRAAEFNEFTPVQKFQHVSDQIAKQYQADHVRESQKIDSLSKDIADVGKEAMGYQDAEFDEFLRENGIKPTSDSVTDHLEAARKIVRDLADAHGVSLTDDQVDHAAQRVVAGGDKDDVFNRLMADLAGISELQGQDFEDVIAIAEQMKEMPDSRERDALETKMYSIIAQNLPARTWFDKMNSFRYLAMLGNPRTHVRNIVGNVMMRGVINMKDGVAAVIQRAVLPEAQRTKSILTPADSDLVNAAKDYAENAAFSRVFRQADGDKFNIRSGIEGARKTFGDSAAGKALQKATDLNSRALQAEDEFFIKSEFANSLAQQMKAQGLGADALTSTDSDMQNRISQMADRAIADAREATFQTDNWLAQKLSDFSKEAQQGSISQKLAYMVTEGILPFKRTPINIAKSALEYNPVGGLAEAVYRYKSGRSTDQVIDSVAKGLTGTTLIGAGYLLAQAGLLNGSGSDDEEENAFNEMQGQQQYAVNIPGVGSYTIDWASPAAIPLLIGAELSNASESENYSAGQVVDALRHMTQPVLETTMLSGLNDTFDEIRYLGDNEDALSAVASSAVGGYFGQFYPTVMGQMARTIDPYRRDSYGGGNSSTERDINYNVRALQNKTPGASMLNEPWIDAWGRPQENAGGNWFGQLVSNTLSPGYFSAENTTPVDKYLQDLYDATSDAGVLPERASSKVEGTYLTPEQKTEFASVRGQTAYDMIEELMNNSTFRGMSDEDQAATIRDIYSLANKVGAAAAIPDYTSDDSLYDVYLNGGVEGVVNYALADASLSNARADKQSSTGDENAKLNSVETWDSMQSLGLDDEALVDTYLAKASDSTAERVNDLVGASGVVAYRDAYANADRDGNGDVTDNELRIALINSGLDDDLVFQTYMATQTTTNDAGETSTDDKAYSAYQTFGTSGGVNWMKYYSAYLVAKAQEQAAAKAAGESADLKGLAESLLNQMDLSVDERRAFFSMTDGRWTGNPY